MTYEKIHGQAKIQFRGRVENRNVHVLLGVEEERGFNRLPMPSEGDIYFDFEGEHFYEDGGLEYLFGFTYKDLKSKEYIYKRFWALDRQQEKDAFRKFVQFLTEHWEKFPGFHVYHFAPYEPAAMAG